jgi:hypothetical protein
MPQGIHLEILPADSPALQPAERLWQLADEPLVNQALSLDRALVSPRPLLPKHPPTKAALVSDQRPAESSRGQLIVAIFVPRLENSRSAATSSINPTERPIQ